MKKTLLIIYFLSFCIYSSFAQREANIWYFGNNAGIDFNSGILEPLNNSQMKTYEGCSVISDTLGNLLFYTNGKTVWNSLHQIMENGENLMGDTSSTQSALIIPKPGSNKIFYIFTADVIIDKGEYTETSGLRYSTIDIEQNNGLGKLIGYKNFRIRSKVTEKLTAVKHNNNKDIWLIAHDWGNNKFTAWLISETGISNDPVISSAGTTHYQIENNFVLNSIGQMKASPDGKKIAVCILRSSTIEILDFNNQTGKIHNPTTIVYAHDTPYGLEFSPDCSKLYFTGYNKLYQIDLNACSYRQIRNSVTEIYEDTKDMGSLQLAPDGKVYLALDYSEYLGIINKPNELHSSCDFDIKGFWLEGKLSRLGLPNFIQSNFKSQFFKVTDNCQGSNAKFIIQNISDIDSVKWDFKDPKSDTSNYSKLISPTHYYSESGIYSVCLKYWKSGMEYNVYENISVISLPDLNLGNDTVLCLGEELNLDASGEHNIYKWHDLSANPTYKVTDEGNYSVEIQNTYTKCINSDTINIKFSEIPEINLGSDTSYCENSSFSLDAYNDNYTYLWSNGSINSTISTTNSGAYNVEVTNEYGCKNSDTINLSLLSLPKVNLGEDTNFCENSSFFLDAYIDDCTYLWNNGSKNSTLTTTRIGMHFVEVTDKFSCKNSDTIYLGYDYLPRFSLGNDTLICENETFTIDINLDNTSFLWQDYSNDSEFTICEKGECFLTTTNKCGNWSDTIYVDYYFCGDIYIPNVISPNNDNINDYFTIKGIEESPWNLTIYSRWGDKVYQTDNYKNDWNAEGLKSNTYFYILSNVTAKRKYEGFVAVYK